MNSYSAKVAACLIPPLLMVAGLSGENASRFAEILLFVAFFTISAHSISAGFSRRSYALVIVLGISFAYFTVRTETAAGFRDVAYVGACFALFLSMAASARPVDISISPWMAIASAATVGFVYVAQPSAIGNPNYIAAAVAATMLPVVFRSSRSVMPLCGTILFLVIFGSRSVLLAALAASMCYYVFRTRHPAAPLIATFIALSTIIIGVYIYFLVQADFYRWNSISLELTGKRIESGRIELWRELLVGRISSEWLFGSDLRTIGYTYTANGLSPHSLYVYTLIRYGLLGLGVFSAVIGFIVVALYRRGRVISLSMVVFFLVRDAFELTLLSNYFVLAALFWTLAASGVLDQRAQRPL